MTTTTIRPANAVTIRYTAVLESALHHGAGTAGNTSILRTHEVALPDGSVARVPFLSAASIRHALRDRLAWHLADTLGLDAGSLSKTAVDLLWSGGAVTTTGAETDLEAARRAQEHLPMLSLFGYAAKSDIIAGTLRASDLMLVCEENAWRLEAWGGDLRPHITQKAAAFRGEEFGTRHDVASTPVARLVASADTLLGDKVKTTQMIFDTQIIKPGARLAGLLEVNPSGTPTHHRVLGAAIALWAPDGIAHLGAKTATGYGRAHLYGLGDHTDDLTWWTSHLEAHASDILQLITDLTS